MWVFQSVFLKFCFHYFYAILGLFATDLEAFREDVYGANTQNAIRNKAAVPRQVESTATKLEPAKKEPNTTTVLKKEVTATKKEAKSDLLAQAFAHAKPKKSPEKEAEVKKAAGGSGKNAVGGAKKGTGNNIASMFAKQEWRNSLA